MTGEEMERAIEFLLKSQADFDARIAATNERLDRTDAQVAETSRQLQAYAETQSEFIAGVTQTIEALAVAQAQTDARLNKLIGLFEQHIIAGH
jgi:septal ring factor EnvC (AmiA/AmiB activator)